MNPLLRLYCAGFQRCFKRGLFSTTQLALGGIPGLVHFFQRHRSPTTFGLSVCFDECEALGEALIRTAQSVFRINFLMTSKVYHGKQ